MRSPMRSPRVCSRAARSASVCAPPPAAQVGIVGGDDGGLLVVVAGVEDEGDGVPDPLVGLLRAEVVEDEDFGGEDGLEQFELGGVDLRVVAVLDVLEQLAVVAEEAADAALLHEAAQDADGEMGFADADGAGEEQALAGGVDGVGLDELARGLRAEAERAVGAVVDLVVVEGAIAVALRNVRRGEAALLALQFAGSRRRARPRVLWRRLLR